MFGKVSKARTHFEFLIILNSCILNDSMIEIEIE